MTTKEFVKYFNNKGQGTNFTLIALGIFILFLGLSIGSENETLIFRFGIVILAIGVFRYFKHKEKLSDAVIDNYCKTQAELFFDSKRSSSMFIEENISDSILYQCYCFDNLFLARLSKRGKDKIMRSSICEIGCLFFANDKVLFFSKKLSLITNEQIEKQNEFMVSDIQNISLEKVSEQHIVSISVLGNETINIHCQTGADASLVYEKIMTKKGGGK